jgi:hypothetical protein
VLSYPQAPQASAANIAISHSLPSPIYQRYDFGAALLTSRTATGCSNLA